MTQSNRQPGVQAPRNLGLSRRRLRYTPRDQRLMDELRDISAMLYEQSDPIFHDIGSVLRRILVRFRLDTVREQLE